MSLRLLLVDDSRAVLDALSLALAKDPTLTIVATATSGHRALKVLHESTIDVVLLDMNMPRLNGLETLSLIRRAHPDVATLVVSNHSDMSWVVPALRDGAVGYVVKSATTAEICSAIHAAFRRERPLSSDVVSTLVATHSQSNATRTHLSPREHETLLLIADGHTTAEIASKQHLSPSAVKKSVSSIKTKLGVQTRAQAVAAAARQGITSGSPE